MSFPNAFDVAQQTVAILLPEILLLLAAIGIITASPFIRRPRQTWCAVSGWAMLLALVVLLAQGGKHTDIYSAVALNDDWSFYARIVLLLAGLVVLGLAHEEPADNRAGEFFGTLLLIDAGSMLVAAANELVFLFVGLELVSIPTYLLLYLTRRDRATQEAATKYFFLSIFSSALLLYGLAFLYGTTGLSNLKALAFLFEKLPNVPQAQLGFFAIVFVLAGLCFRVTAVPLHFYAPDVYEGSPIVTAAILAWVPKAVGFLAMVRALTAVFSVKDAGDPVVRKAVMICWVIAAASVIWGNFVALLQDNLKRLMAYSSIAHAGYLMIGVTAAFANDRHAGRMYFGAESVFFYLIVYALMTLGTFGGFIALKIRDRGAETVDDLAGLGWSQPWLALALSICLLSLTGIPPLAGFWGKFEVFAALLAAERRDESWSFVVLAVIGMLGAAVGAYYYLRLVVLMYFRPAREPVAVRGGWPLAVSVAACAGLTVALGLPSSLVASAARTAAQAALAHPAPSSAPVTAASGLVAPSDPSY
jgi:NADH-quinone oxidoreductase subunit N